MFLKTVSFIEGEFCWLIYSKTDCRLLQRIAFCVYVCDCVSQLPSVARRWQ
jgi:hypothetical protein